MIITPGSLWRSSGSDMFRVISTVTIEGAEWVHYCKASAPQGDVEEYSCLQDSFLFRFTAYENTR
jgi:hypothetical protein